MDKQAYQELNEFKKELNEFHIAFQGLVDKGILKAVGMNHQGEVQYQLDERGIELAKYLGLEESETTEQE